MVAFPFRLFPRTIVLFLCLAVLDGSFTDGDVIHWYWKRERARGHQLWVTRGPHFNWARGRYFTRIKLCNLQFSDPKWNNDTIFKNKQREKSPNLGAAVLITTAPMCHSHWVLHQIAEKDLDSFTKSRRKPQLQRHSFRRTETSYTSDLALLPFWRTFLITAFITEWSKVKEKWDC